MSGEKRLNYVAKRGPTSIFVAFLTLSRRVDLKSFLANTLEAYEPEYSYSPENAH